MMVRFWLKGAIQAGKTWFTFAPRRRKPRRQGIAAIGGGQSSRLQAAAFKHNVTRTMDRQTVARLQSEGLSSNEIDNIAAAQEANERRHEAWLERQAQFRRQAQWEDRREERRLAEARLQRELDPQASAQSRRAAR